MINLQTITTIELSSKCQMACKYCVNRRMLDHGRKPAIMPDAVFERALSWLKQLCEQGTQKEVNINGNGESLLDPQIVERVRRIKAVMGYGMVAGCTNGIVLTEPLARKLKAAGLDRLDVSPHSPLHARRAFQIIQRVGLMGIVNFGTIMQPHNWAGQIEPEYSVDHVNPIPCVPLMEGRGYIQSEGQVSPCCYDYCNLGVYGSVFDDDLLSRPIKPFSLCDTCHQIIPEHIRGAA